MNLELHLISGMKITSRYIIDLELRAEVIKLEESLELGKYYLRYDIKNISDNRNT